MAEKKLFSDGFSKLVSTVGAVSLAFLAGLVWAHYKWFPYLIVSDGIVAGEALIEKLEAIRRAKGNPYNDVAWRKVRFPKSGVTVYDQDNSHGGFTLYTSGGGTEAFLINMEGEVVHRWAKRFREVWPDAGHIKMPDDESLINWRRAYVMPNGDLFAIYEGMADTPYGYGLVKLNKDSEVIWDYPERTHHDMTFGEDGLIYVLGHGFRYELGKGLNTVRPPILDDYIAVLSKDGKEINRYSVIEAFRRSIYIGFLNSSLTGAGRNADITHVNTIKLIDEGMAKSFGPAKKGQFLIAGRNMSFIAILDPETRKITWAQRGFWYWPHDIDLLDNGRMLIFDNLGAWGVSGVSRVVEFDPLTLDIFWQYHGEKRKPLKTAVRGSQQRFANGNTMIVESNSGRIVEVTQNKKIVWEFISPVRGGKNGHLQAVITDAERYDRSALPFLDGLKNKK